VACTEPNDPRLPLIGCCGSRPADLYLWSAGQSGPAQSAFQPFEPANFYQISAIGRSTDHLSPIPLSAPNQDIRYQFSFRGVWQAVQPGIWDVLSGAALLAALPKRTANRFGSPVDLFDYSLPLFMHASCLPIVPIFGGGNAVLLNSVVGPSLNDNATYRFERTIDVWPGQVTSIALPWNIFAAGE
jgi:hypothetical protein